MIRKRLFDLFPQRSSTANVLSFRQPENFSQRMEYGVPRGHRETLNKSFGDEPLLRRVRSRKNGGNIDFKVHKLSCRVNARTVSFGSFAQLSRSCGGDRARNTARAELSKMPYAFTSCRCPQLLFHRLVLSNEEMPASRTTDSAAASRQPRRSPSFVPFDRLRE